MSDEHKSLIVLIVSIALLFGGMLSLWAYSMRNQQNYAMACLANGKSIQFRMLPGKETEVKECR